MLRLFLLLLLLPAMAAAQPRSAPGLIAEISPRQIDIHTTFRGVELLVFGAIQYPGGRIPEESPDVVVALRGPAGPVVVRRKERVAGIWVNTDAVRFETVPGYFSVASTRPMQELVDDRVRAIYELGIESLQLSPASGEDEAVRAEFERGLIATRQRAGLFAENQAGVAVTGQVLYQARLQMPATVPVGHYEVEVHLVERGRVLASAALPLDVEKSGFERWVYRMAQEYSLLYGLAAVLAALAAGGIASLVTRRR